MTAEQLTNYLAQLEKALPELQANAEAAKNALLRQEGAILAVRTLLSAAQQQEAQQQGRPGAPRRPGGLDRRQGVVHGRASVRSRTAPQCWVDRNVGQGSGRTSRGSASTSSSAPSTLTRAMRSGRHRCRVCASTAAKP